MTFGSVCIKVQSAVRLDIEAHDCGIGGESDDKDNSAGTFIHIDVDLIHIMFIFLKKEAKRVEQC